MARAIRWDSPGENIPLWGRICAVADTFDAVTSERSYKPAYSNDIALRILREESGKQFDPRIVEVFFECFDESSRCSRSTRIPSRPPKSNQRSCVSLTSLASSNCGYKRFMQSGHTACVKSASVCSFR